MLEVRYVLSLAHHDVSIYGGGEFIPEGELFIKRNALCLTRKSDAGEMTADGSSSKPFYLFADNTSDKEDFYFAMLKSQERTPDALNNPPVPIQFDIKHMISLVQRLHSSEEHLQTRWINALLGRIFLALYKTSDVENFIRAKITKKISRVKRPSFLSGIVLRHVDMGEGAPYITNPRLKDLTVDGDCVLEADLQYTGNFRLEIAATARIDLGTRFKAREVNLLLAVVLKKIEGHVLLKIKPPPSNRIWITFATAPNIEMSIEPIVSSRQITYTIILRQIESRIKEVIAESIVMPFWDDISFFPTDGKRWRGGVWVDDKRRHSHPDLQTAAAEGGEVEELEQLEAHPVALSASESSTSVPLMENEPSSSTHSRKSTRSLFNLGGQKAGASSSSIDLRPGISDKPKAIRHGSFSSTSSPIVSTEFTNVDALKSSTPPAAAAMAALSARSNQVSPAQTPLGSPSRPSGFREKSASLASVTSFDSNNSIGNLRDEITPHTESESPVEEVSASGSGQAPSSPASISAASFNTESIKSFLHSPGRQDSAASSVLSNDTQEHLKDSSSTRSLIGSFRSRNTGSLDAGNGADPQAPPKRITLTAVANAAANARKWGLDALQRRADQAKEISAAKSEALAQANQPMGRGRPLPPPGMPLPPPDRKTPTAPIPVPKRKTIPPPLLPQRPRQQDSKGSSSESVTASSEQENTSKRSNLPNPPALPRRRTKHMLDDNRDANLADDGIFVVAAPADSEPTTPLNEARTNYLPPWVDDAADDEDTSSEPVSPRLPARRRAGTSSSPEDDKKLPSWMAAQEEESRAKSLWVDDDAGHDH